MSEYTEPHAVHRMIGSPPGYVGFEMGGQLTEAVRTAPHNVVLLDEIEKAHPQVLAVLLQLMDEGRLTDGRGRTVDFNSTVVILTSNMGANALLHAASQCDQFAEGSLLLVLSCLVLSCLVLSCLVLSCLVLPCLVL